MKQPKPSTPAPSADPVILSHEEAEASSPEDVAVAGEEDPGAALEDLVEPKFGKNSKQVKPGKPLAP